MGHYSDILDAQAERDAKERLNELKAWITSDVSAKTSADDLELIHWCVNHVGDLRGFFNILHGQRK